MTCVQYFNKWQKEAIKYTDTLFEFEELIESVGDLLSDMMVMSIKPTLEGACD